MSNIKKIDLLQFKSNFSSTNLITRPKKLPPPPLCLPAASTTTDEENPSTSHQQYEQKQSTNNCCLSSSSKECPHENIPFILPIGQRPQILEKLLTSSSTLLVAPSSDTKQRKSQTNLSKSKQGTVTDAEWLEFIRLIVQKPLENDLKMLLDKYKMTYFDRVNAPDTTDATIRAALCDMVSETLTTYSTSSSLPVLPSSSSVTVNGAPTNVSSSITATSISSKRKRKTTNTNISESSTIGINTQTTFVISYIIPGKCDNNINSNKTINQQRYKQFQKKYSHLFKYIPDKDEQAYLIREGHLENISVTSSRSSNNHNICLMLYDEVLGNMDENDFELCGISIDDSFTLPDLILTHIYSSIQ